jgi:amino acid transporter
MNWIDLILGRRLASNEKDQAQMGVLAGVPAMGLDGLSSAAYGPEAALTLLVPLGIIGLHWIVPITLVIIVLLGLLYTSYRQTIAAYPQGGGSYTVAGENLGVWPGLLAAAALMVDYLLNVAVGISAGIAALVSAVPSLHHFTLPLCLVVLAIITLLNLRGTGEAGLAFALPTYVFILALVGVIVVGTVKSISFGGHPPAIVPPSPIAPATMGFSVWLLMRAFASGCTAMTGVEAVSNGVGAFKEPTVKRAHWTLTIIVATLALLLGGVAYLAQAYHVDAMDQSKPGYQSILSQLIAAVAGRGWIYKITIGSVLCVLCLSANTSFVGFPRLCRLIARNDYLPRAFAVSGRRLVYSVGVISLAVAAGLLLFAFDGITDRLIPLFAVGAFLAFTLSQAGMVVHWRRELKKGNGKGASLRLAVNAAGTCATACALVIILAAKFLEGAWIVVVIVPLLLMVFAFVHRHYAKFNRQIAAPVTLRVHKQTRPIALVPTRGPDCLTEKAMLFAMWLSDDVCALHLSNLSGEEAREEDRKVRQGWEVHVVKPARENGVPAPHLEVVQTPYRSYVEPVLDKIDRLKQSHPDRTVAVVLPEVVVTHWWQGLLHGRKSLQLRSALLNRGDHHVVVIEVPWYLNE